ncbi:RHS repeat-associated core domain-containing protein [Undibacterium sp. LX15W]|uniref:RHS repeat-associated core domain-containing protein n=2 Tax=Undibacterium flavidum TaxID=2762297 RepID=A0ABR6YEF4_9BURK|nr:RHS repeat-associated core domain-containing protein [Undibacterium flavidum]
MKTVPAPVAGVTYIHTDGLGSPVAKSDANGNLIAGSRTRYEPYGMAVAGTATPTIGFTGHVNDADTGLTYMQQRYYDPVAGRFLSTDPVLTDYNTGASFNRYTYALNNPYKYIDPDGRDPCEWCKKTYNYVKDKIYKPASEATKEVNKVLSPVKKIENVVNKTSEISQEMQKVEDRRAYAEANNQPDKSKGETVTSTDPKTGAPYILGQIRQNHADEKANTLSGMVVVEKVLSAAGVPDPSTKKGAEEIAKKAIEAAEKPIK